MNDMTPWHCSPGKLLRALHAIPSRGGSAVGRLVTLLSAAVVWLPLNALAAGGGSAEPIVFVADSRRFSGWASWFSNLYNESLFYFTVLTVVTIPVLGVVLGTIADLVMARIGINLRSRSVAEH
jgi:hypothetical protein